LNGRGKREEKRGRERAEQHKVKQCRQNSFPHGLDKALERDKQHSMNFNPGAEKLPGADSVIVICPCIILCSQSTNSHEPRATQTAATKGRRVPIKGSCSKTEPVTWTQLMGQRTNIITSSSPRDTNVTLPYRWHKMQSMCVT